jgi:hypothetical protein
MNRCRLLAESVAIMQVLPVGQSAVRWHEGAQPATTEEPLLKMSTHACGEAATQSALPEHTSVQNPSQEGHDRDAQAPSAAHAVPSGAPPRFPWRQ